MWAATQASGSARTATAGPVRILANPISGRGRGRRRAERLAAALTRAGHAVELEVSTDRDDLRAKSAATSAGRCRAIAVVGGDGTLRDVVEALPDPAPPLALLATGTANSLACEFRLPRRPSRLAGLIDAGRIVELPIARVRCDGDPALCFVCFVGAGFDAAMVAELERRRDGALPGRIGWLLPVLRAVWRFPVHRLTLCSADPPTERTDRAQVLATRIRNYGSVFRLPRVVDARRPALFALDFPQLTRLGWLRVALGGWLRGLRPRPGSSCQLTIATRLTIDSRAPVPVHADGDLISHGARHVEISLTDRSLPLLVSPQLRPATPL